MPETRSDSLVIVPHIDGGRLEVGVTLAGAAAGLTADVLVFENAEAR